MSDDLNELTESLVRQYSGAVPARSVARTVDHVARSMRRKRVDEERVVARTERVVRRMLIDMALRPPLR